MNNTAVTINLHYPKLGEINQLPSGTVCVDISDYPIITELFFEDIQAVVRFAQSLWSEALTIGVSPKEMENDPTGRVSA